MKATSMKGLPGNKMSFTKYTGNVISSGGALPSGKRESPAGKKVASNLNKKAVMKKPGNVY